MIPYEVQYITNISAILSSGSFEINKRTGIATKRLPATQFIVNLEEDFPILLSKKVFWKSAIKEIFWIMQKQSNVTAELGSHIWDAWTGPDGTIGKSYGYQIGQATRGYKNQVEYILNILQTDPSNRQCVINMWNVADLTEMNLVPCCYSSVWNIIDGKLNCMLVQRSADYPVGVPFDTLQYAALTFMFARHLGVKPGLLTHVMADSHIYDNQILGVETQLKQYNELKTLKHKTPKLIFKDDAPTNFWELTINDIDIVDYEPMPAIKYDVAV